jgi:hypothetical protein
VVFVCLGVCFGVLCGLVGFVFVVLWCDVVGGVFLVGCVCLV